MAKRGRPRISKAKTAHSRALIKYNAKNYDRILLKLFKGERELVKEKAASLGMSVNAYLLSLLAREIPGITERRVKESEEESGTDNNV